MVLFFDFQPKTRPELHRPLRLYYILRVVLVCRRRERAGRLLLLMDKTRRWRYCWIRRARTLRVRPAGPSVRPAALFCRPLPGPYALARQTGQQHRGGSRLILTAAMARRHCSRPAARLVRGEWCELPRPPPPPPEQRPCRISTASAGLMCGLWSTRVATCRRLLASSELRRGGPDPVKCTENKHAQKGKQFCRY